MTKFVDPILNPKSVEEQAACGHKDEDLWICLVPHGKVYCPKCGWSRPMTEQEFMDEMGDPDDF